MLLQNNLAEATTELGFPAETGLPVAREVELEDGTVVTVESVVPEVMAQTLNSHFITPGEKYMDNGNDLNGVVQNYNESDTSDLGLIEVGKTYKFNLKKRIKELDDLETAEEYSEFIQPYIIEIGDTTTGTGISIPEGTVAYGINQSVIMYLTNVHVKNAESAGADIYEFGYRGPGWYLSIGEDFGNPERVEPFDNQEITCTINFIAKNEGSVEEFTELDLNNYSWLLKSVEEISEGIPEEISE